MQSTTFPKVALHVTPLEHLDSILEKGLKMQIGQMSEALETEPAVYLFASWESMVDANWMFENWPYESEPILLAVKLDEIDPSNIEYNKGYEMIISQDIPPAATTVLQAHEREWTSKIGEFVAMGGIVETPEPDLSEVLQHAGDLQSQAK